MNAQKNWSDRADRDLFFTILQVKNIGVIGGAEWASIGNSMRTLGYVFTNEGCRQHFQGLRRQQLKSEGSAPPETISTRRPDPALNPIARRPGPGRGRPRKSQSQANGDASESPHTLASGDFVSPTIAASMHDPIPSPVSPPHINSQLPVDAELTASHAVSRVQSAAGLHPAPAARLHHPRPAGDDDVSDERHPVKRPKIKSGLDDETVLALAPGSEPGALDHYQFAAYPDP